jgi:predicted hydrocarbon binding protein
MRPLGNQVRRMDEAMRMRDGCESFLASLLNPAEEPSSFLTTGLLNGLFSVVEGRHIRESKCIGVGDPYCEWEFRRC